VKEVIGPMAENDKDNEIKSQPEASSQDTMDTLDAGGKSLSEALRLSFIILKIVMVILVIIFLASGFRTVEPGERALVLRFGEVQGVDEHRLLEPGLHWVLPYPIDRLVKIPVGQKVTMAINSFWYYQTPKEILAGGKGYARRTDPLRPMIDGYCVTRSEKYAETVGDSEGSDYNIVHCKWKLTYKVNDNQAERFFRNVYVEEVKPGEDYTVVIAGSVEPLLKSVVEDAVVTSMVNYTIDEVKFERVAAVTSHVRGLIQRKLDEMETGLEVVSLQLTDSTWPLQVDRAFEASIVASQASQQALSEARTYANKTLNEAGGPVAGKLLAALKYDDISEESKERLWSQVAGAAREKIADARAYRTKVVETAKASAEYLAQILPEYHKHPKLVLQSLYLDAMEYIFGRADEIFVVQPGKNIKDRELRVLLSRDPTIKRKPGKAGD